MAWLDDVLKDAWDAAHDHLEVMDPIGKATPLDVAEWLYREAIPSVADWAVDFAEGIGHAVINIVNPPDIPDFKAPTPGAPQAPDATARLRRRKTSSANMFGATSPFVIQPPSGGGVNVPGN